MLLQEVSPAIADAVNHLAAAALMEVVELCPRAVKVTSVIEQTKPTQNLLPAAAEQGSYVVGT
jgi:hypothetical protein